MHFHALAGILTRYLEGRPGGHDDPQLSIVTRIRGTPIADSVWVPAAHIEQLAKHRPGGYESGRSVTYRGV